MARGNTNAACMCSREVTMKKYPLECLAAVAACFGLLVWCLSQILPIVSAWWSEHWLLVTIMGGIIGLGILAYSCGPAVWRADGAISDHADTPPIPEHPFPMLVS